MRTEIADMILTMIPKAERKISERGLALRIADCIIFEYIKSPIKHILSGPDNLEDYKKMLNDIVDDKFGYKEGK